MPRLHKEVMRLLIGEIVSGMLATGERLPREADLAEQHQVSYGVARECIRGLEERGLVSVLHGSGATVTPPERWDIFDPDVVAALLQGDGGDRVLREYLECRRIFEVEAAGLAAERATRADVKALEVAFEEMTAAAQRARSNPAAEPLYHEADIVFHRAVILAAENRALARITEPLHRTLTASLQRSARPKIRLERGLPEHERILDAIVARDPTAARRAMGDHLASVEVALKDAARPARRARSRRARRPVAGAAAG